VDIESYVGTWYQIASTARYKLSYESGLVCEQANYTLLSEPVAARISVVNSGAAVISRPEAAALSRFSLTAGAVCSNARIICSLATPRTSRLRQSLAALGSAELALSDAHPSTAAELHIHTRSAARLLRLVESEIESLALNASLIQQAHARLSQDVGRRSDNIHHITDLAALTAAAVGTLSGRLLSGAEVAAREILRLAASVVAGENPSLAYQMSGAALGVAGELVRIRSFLGRAAVALTNLETMYSSFGKTAAAAGPSWGRAPPVMYGLGFQNSSSSGKFLMDFYGIRSPYWIIGLEGSAAEGYEAALVYWCREDLYGEIDEDLFVLSRNRELEDGVLEKFMAAAARYGIYPDCDNPLVITDQRSGSCGAP
jgi:lipocalin